MTGGLSVAMIDYRRVIKHGNEQNHSFMKDFPIEASIYRGFPIAMFDYQRVYSPSVLP